LTYSFIYNGPFLDWGLRNNFLLNLSKHEPTIFDGGDVVFSTTTLATVGDTVAAVFLNPEETKNRIVYVQDLKTTQNELYAAAKKAAPNKPWQVKQAKVADAAAKADERLAKGIFDFETFEPYLHQSVVDPACGCNFAKTDNELLGIKGKPKAYLDELLKDVLN
jgi:hypothetical protein